jgi:hypothetical protein
VEKSLNCSKYDALYVGGYFPVIQDVVSVRICFLILKKRGTSSGIFSTGFNFLDADGCTTYTGCAQMQASAAMVL